MGNRKRPLCLALASAMVATITIAGQAAADDGPTVPVIQERLEATINPYDTVPPEVHEFAKTVYGNDQVVSTAWDGDRGELSILVDPGFDLRAMRSLVAQAGVESSVRLEHSTYSNDQLTKAVDEVMTDRHFQGFEVSWAAPRPDGTGVDIGVVDDAPRALHFQLTTDEGVPVRIESIDEAEPASRDFDPGPQFIAGADMHRDAGPGRISRCSTAFAHYWRNGQTGIHEPRMFTADHCNEQSEHVWRTGLHSNNPEIGTNQGGFGTESDIAAIGGKDYGPYMYHGPNTSNAAVAIWGWATPLVGAHLCYSGAPSGTICSNQVTHVNLTVNYGSTHTYNNLMRTVQVHGMPAVGNGDSGGPAFTVFQDGRALAVGIISGMSNAGTTCSGDPSTSTRRCSDIAFMAPLADYFHFNPTDFLRVYIP